MDKERAMKTLLLVASDPASVQVGMGKPVLLEFFRFT